MSHDHEATTDGTPAATEPAPEHGEPAFLTRARRILGGDIRPEDYLPVTPEVQAAADFELVYVRDHMKRESAPEWAANQLRAWLLSFHYGGKNIAYTSDDIGVIVLAAEDEVGKLIDYLDTNWQEGVIFSCPEPF